MLAAQLIHASGESSPGNLAPGTIAVALSVEDESELLKLENYLIEHDVKHVAIREPDRNCELMAIGVIPDYKNELSKHFANLKLVR